MSNPQLIIVLTGSRACAKAFMAKVLHCVVGDGNCYTVHLMDTIESLWLTEDAENNPMLQLQPGTSVSNAARERYRRAMIDWSNDIRSRNPRHFCKIACNSAPSRERWFVCGVKRVSEINWFKKTFGSVVKTVRISTIENLSKERLWQICNGDKDDDIGEFDLENYDYDLKLYHSSLEELSESLQIMVYFMQRFVKD